MRPTISVMVLTGDRLFAEALEAMLAREEDLRVLSLTREPVEAAPDVVVIDATRSLEAALSHTIAVRGIFPHAGVIILGPAGEDELVLDFIEAGASGYVLDSTPPAGLLVTLRAVHGGEAACTPRIAASVLERIGRLARERPAPPAPGEALTARELEVLHLLAGGLQNKEIGRLLGITVQTVKNHVHSILSKLGVRGRRRAVRRAYETGLLHQDDAPLNPF